MTLAFAADAKELKNKVSPPYTIQLATIQHSRDTPTHSTDGSIGGVGEPCRPRESSLPAAVEQQEGVVSPTIWRCETQTPGPTEQQRLAAAGSRGGGSPKDCSTVSATQHPSPTHHPPSQPAASEERSQVPQSSATTTFAANPEPGIISVHPSPKTVLQWDIDEEFLVPRPLTLEMP